MPTCKKLPRKDVIRMSPLLRAIQWNFSCQITGWSLTNSTTDEMSLVMTKPTKWHVRPANTQISLGQADLSFRWAHMSFRWFCHGEAHVFLCPYLTIVLSLQREIPLRVCDRHLALFNLVFMIRMTETLIRMRQLTCLRWHALLRYMLSSIFEPYHEIMVGTFRPP